MDTTTGPQATSVAAVILRLAVVVALAWAAMTLVDTLSGPTIGANIGAGLAGLLAAALVPGVWGLVDGRRGAHVREVLLRWAAVAVLAVPAFTAASQLGAPVPFDYGLWAMELVTSGWFFGALVAGPSLVGVAIGAAVRASPRAVPTV